VADKLSAQVPTVLVVGDASGIARQCGSDFEFENGCCLNAIIVLKASTTNSIGTSSEL